eukprot:g5079.t1
MLFRRTLARCAEPRQDLLRNIGILAHVDHGKTTITERMLYYAGKTRNLGSGSVSFDWKDHTFSLIDTPGHVDFTFETQRSLRVLDGAVIVLDAVSGVQSQTMTVWRQANNFSTPRFAFVNKMDRDGASLERVAKSVSTRLGVESLMVQIPVGEEKDFCGVIDLVSMMIFKWDESGKSGGGEEYTVEPLGRDHPQFDEAVSARETLVDQLSEMDEALADIYLERMMEEDASEASMWSHDDSPDGTSLMSDAELWSALRRVVLDPDSGGVVTMCGAAAKNVGVQPMMDAVIRLLPSPNDAPKHAGRTVKSDEIVEIENDPKAPLVAAVFKVQHDSQRGGVCFFRVYSGTMKSRQVLFNTTMGEKERANKLLLINADDNEEVDSISAGSIGAAVGLKYTRTGDTLVANGAPNQVVLQGIDIPTPVFTSSVSVPSSDQDKLNDALTIMEREDPSLRVVLEDPETEQTLISGMGELHMEIVGDKLKTQFKLPKVQLGDPMVAFRESLVAPVSATYESESYTGDTRHYAKVSLELSPLQGGGAMGDTCYDANALGINFDRNDSASDESPKKFYCNSNGLSFSHVEDPNLQSSQVAAKYKDVVEPIASGVQQALKSGPLGKFTLAGVNVVVKERECEFTDDSSPAAISRAASRAVKRALESNLDNVQFVEPVMSVEITADATCVGSVLADLNSSRRAAVHEVGGDDGETSNLPGVYSTVMASIPLKEMVGYSTSLRSMTAGEGTFSMAFEKYVPVLAKKTSKEIIEKAEEEASIGGGVVAMSVVFAASH